MLHKLLYFCCSVFLFNFFLFCYFCSCFVFVFCFVFYLLLFLIPVNSLSCFLTGVAASGQAGCCLSEAYLSFDNRVY